MIPSVTTLRSTGLSIVACSLLSVDVAHGRQHQESDHQESDHQNEEAHEAPALDFADSWFSPWPHNHFSQRGIPFVHAFNLEPAFLGQDLFLTYGSAQGDDGKESELEVELEWALTRRLGLVLEAPYVQLDPDGGEQVEGVGDSAVAGRALLVETETFLLAGSLEVSLPSGDEDKDLGSDEVGLAPSLSAWLDLGGWLQSSAQLGTEHGLDSGDSELFYGVALAYVFSTHAPHTSAKADHGHSGAHSSLGVTSGILEFTGRTITNGLDEGDSSSELLIGVGHNLTRSLEIRAGYQFPVGGNQDFDDGFTFGVVHHF